MEYLSKTVQNYLVADFEKGTLFTKKDQNEVGSVGSGGYIYVAVPDVTTSSGWKNLKRSRIIFFLAYGYWPEQVDHINRCETDDRLCNLRNVDARGQALNRVSSDNGLPVGVQVSGRNFKSSIYIDKQSYHLGTFPTIKEAAQAYEIASQQLEQGIKPEDARKRKQRQYIDASMDFDNLDSDIIVRMEHIFQLYPKISPSMLQISLNVPAKKWRPVLEYMIGRGKVRRDTLVSVTPTGRNQTYTILEWALETSE